MWETNLDGLMAFVGSLGQKKAFETCGDEDCYAEDAEGRIPNIALVLLLDNYRRLNLVSASTCAAPRLGPYVQKRYSAGREQATTNG